MLMAIIRVKAKTTMEALTQDQSIFSTFYDFSASQKIAVEAWSTDVGSLFNSQSIHNLALPHESTLDHWLERVTSSINLSAIAPELDLFKRSGHYQLADTLYSPAKAAIADQDSLTGLSQTDSTAGMADLAVHHYQGSLRADWFTYTGQSQVSIYSGHGNVDFGSGCWDILDLSHISINDVTSWDPAFSRGGGVLLEMADGLRVFDVMTLSNGNVILMEGLDGLVFQEGWYDFNQNVLPNDPLFEQQWSLHMMGVHNAWRFTQGTESILLGVQDSGLAFNRQGLTHSDIDLSRTYGIAGNIQDDFGQSISHGTPVQGIMAANSNNGQGMSGINWHSDMVNIDVLDGDPTDLDLDRATQIMTDHARSTGRRVVINMSLGAHGAPMGWMPTLEDLIARNQDNALFVISAGNDDDAMLSYPAILANAYSNVIAVGASWGTQDWFGQATNPGDRISYPGQWGSNYGWGLSLMGPSEVIATRAELGWSDVQFGYHLNAPMWQYGTEPFNGTSAAAPNVSGVASLVWSANPGLSAVDVHGILARTAYDLGAPGYDPIYGHGFVNADAAVRKALALSRVNSQVYLAPNNFGAEVTAMAPSGDWSTVLRPLAEIIESFQESGVEVAPTHALIHPSTHSLSQPSPVALSARVGDSHNFETIFKSLENQEVLELGDEDSRAVAIAIDSRVQLPPTPYHSFAPASVDTASLESLLAWHPSALFDQALLSEVVVL
jgi:serine protease